ncbi:MAG: FAD-dependent oxidoreductase, partial [Deltaproteobacteria bacterium]|nr:FAD-dependent oxidoreductase [Deltaproteobacteria bacterium]
QSTFVREGIDLQLGVKILRIEKRDNSRMLHLERDGQQIEVATDQIMVGVGRTPNTEGLGLRVAGVEFDKNGVKVNDRLQTTNANIYAAGDICSTYKFTHLADAQARILLANALFNGRQKTSSLTIPWCIYTDPEIA